MGINCAQGNDSALIIVSLFTSQPDNTPTLSAGVMPQFLVIIGNVLTRLSFAFCHFRPSKNIQTKERQRERDIISLDANEN
jgi:hypothetical protein